MIFTDGKDLKGIKRAQDIKYMRVLRFSLRIITAWPEREIEGVQSKYHIYKKCYTFFIELICLFPGMLYLKNNYNVIPFFDLGHTYITVFMNVIAVCRLVLIFLQSYADTLAYFVNVIHLFNYRAKTEYAKETQLLVHKLSHFFTILMKGQIIGALLLFNTTPLCNNVLSGGFSGNRSEDFKFDQSVYYALPFDYERDITGYIIIFVFNWYISYICTTIICITDLLLSLMSFHVWGHLKILIHSLENFPRPLIEVGNNAMYSSQEMETVRQLLLEYITHHRVIKHFVTKMSDTFGPILFIYFIFQQVTGCLMLLQCSQMETRALVRYGPMSVMFFQQLAQLYIVFELLGTLGDALSDAVYSVPWECMNQSQRKILYIFLKESQKPIKFKAMGVVNLGVETMAMIIKTSFSYFIMLRTL
ncbi:odorant receptor 13a-like [Epargyreus clarus]|uniref:odorant receptor 13a-like n=1 Tax=Epargyreus clarus TaxID=520877 RepID=UPI003C2FFBD3